MKIILLLSFYFLPNLGLNAALDTFPPRIKSLGIRNNLFHIHKRDFSSGKVLSIFSIKDFTKNQVDSFLLALNDDNLINPYLILSAGLWQMDSKDVHQRLCSFITLDTLDYSGRWGENRRPPYNKNEWAVRLALARLGYPYHVDFIAKIFKEQDLLYHNIAGKFVLYTRYINKEQITNVVLDQALKDHFYAYIDTENHQFYDTTSYYLSAVIMAGLPINIVEKNSYPKKRSSNINDEDIAQFKQWIMNSKRKNITLKEDSLLIMNGHFLSSGILIWPNADLRELRSLAAAKSTNRGTKNRPHINYQGACYFQGDTIFVNRHETERMWLMAWQKDGQIMGSNSEWQGVSATEMGTYARIDKKIIPPKRPRKVGVSCFGCGEKGGDLELSVYVVGKAIDTLIETKNELFEADYTIQFEAYKEQYYGFDKVQYTAMVNQYNQLPIAGTDYKAAWKSVESGKTDSVLVDHRLDELARDLTFEDNNSKKVSFSNHQGYPIIAINSRAHKKVYPIYPVQTKQDSIGNTVKKYAGKLNVITYDKKEINVVLVPLGNIVITERQKTLIEKGLNDIYKPAITSFSLEYTDPIQVEDFDGSLLWSGSEVLSAYDEQMHDLINMVFEGIDYSYEKYYVFIVDESACGCVKGFMPQKRQIGFVVNGSHNNTSELTRTIAQELGHGVFNLKQIHTDYPSLNTGSTDNLMDKGNGTKLHKYQWDLIQNPAFNITLFGD